MKLYSYKGEEPKELPFRIILDDGSVRTSLEELSDDELKNFGFVLIKKPKYNKNFQKIVWKESKYEIIDLTDQEIEYKKREKKEKIKQDKIKNINYIVFFNDFINTNFYKKFRSCISKSKELIVIFNEFLFLLQYEKNKIETNNNIQKYINIFFVTCEFSDEEMKEIKKLFLETNINQLYSLPSKKFIKDNFYNFSTHTIIKNSPFESWKLVNNQWKPPIPYPTDGIAYKWSEEEYNSSKNGWILAKSNCPTKN